MEIEMIFIFCLKKKTILLICLNEGKHQIRVAFTVNS